MDWHCKMITKPSLTDHDAGMPENDALWKLLGAATRVEAGPRFVEQTVRAARMLEAPGPWWKRMLAPAPLAGLASSCAMIALAWMFWPSPDEAAHVLASELDRAAEIAEIADTETLIAAVEHMDEFSDTELVTLIGF
jgi:hypothetical protein